MSTNSINIRPLTTALGAEVLGVDLSKPLSNTEFDAVHRALLDHLVIFFRDQEVSPDEQIAFGRKFGALDVHPFAPALADHPEVMTIVKEPDDQSGIRFGGIWHSDTTFYEEPVMGSILYAREVPEVGGDTMFANMYLAYETLSDGMKEMLSRLNAIHSPAKSYGKGGRLSDTGKAKKNISMKTRTDDGEDIYAEVIHPVIRTHPETGERVVYVNNGFTSHIEGLSKDESRWLLDHLYKTAWDVEIQCRFRWQAGSVAFWDNRVCQHFAVSDYFPARRVMERVTVAGDKPYFTP